jgi:hypothetical protein
MSAAHAYASAAGDGATSRAPASSSTITAPPLTNTLNPSSHRIAPMLSVIVVA